jgi:hypothetical protein
VIFIRAFEPDEDYDRTHASNGVSRYGAYLAQHAHLFSDGDNEPTTDPELFAAAAWRIAQLPTMCPGYVRAHGRVQATSVHWDEDGLPAVCVELAVSSAPEAACFTFPWRRWTRDELGHWVAPVDHSRPNVITALRIAVPLAGVSLPHPCYENDQPDTATAKQAVKVICRVLNAPLAYVLAFDPLTGDTR